MKMKYFAYGSNMSLKRLEGRISSAERIGAFTFTLTKHSLRFHKKSKDKSGKCNAFFTGKPKDSVIGALFEIQEDQISDLDGMEALGNGYLKKDVLVSDTDGNPFEAFTYYACPKFIDDSLQPYSWYLDHVIRGAEEIKVPASYLDAIKETKSKEDLDKGREKEERKIYL